MNNISRISLSKEDYYKIKKNLESKKISNNDKIKKLYIEPTTKCNLDCKICPRNTWTDETIGDMDIELFKTLLEQVKNIDSIETISFGGVAEPISHKNIIEMIQLSKSLGVRVELISNGSLLDKGKIESILLAGLDMLWVSIDKAHSESQRKLYKNDGLEQIKDNLFEFRRKRNKINQDAELGISFVAMKSNIDELPEIINLGSIMEASEVKVSNLIPYTKEMQEEILYDRTMSCGFFKDELPYRSREVLNLPIMDFELIPQNVLKSVVRSRLDIQLGKNRIARDTGYCKFIQDDSLFIRWDGEVCPCMALLHNNVTYLHNIERDIRFCSYGNIKEESLIDIWEKEDYRNFRSRVKEFSFSPCTMCGLCDYVESNEEDCFGNTFPTCGACLWAEGFAQCP